MTPKARSRWGALVAVVKICILVVLFAWLINTGRLDLQAIRGLESSWILGAAAGARALGGVIRSFRWQILANAKGLDVPLRLAVKAGFIGSFMGLFIPAGLGGDSARAYLGLTRNSGRSDFVISSVVMDRFVGAVTLGLLALTAATILNPQDHKLLKPMLLGAGLLLGAAVGAAVLFCSLEKSPFIRWKSINGVSRAIRGYWGNPWILTQAALLGVAGNAMIIAATYGVFVVIGNGATLGQVCLIQPLVSLCRAIPTTPLGLGVIDSVAEALYRMVGVETGAEMTLVIRGLDLCVAALGAVFLVAPSRLRTHDDSRHPANLSGESR